MGHSLVILVVTTIAVSAIWLDIILIQKAKHEQMFVKLLKKISKNEPHKEHEFSEWASLSREVCDMLYKNEDNRKKFFDSIDYPFEK